ncbi:hypothetical protein MNBD_ALPHA07-1734 [hydrothermal vent metagenome]|uniref:Uncharacterized protein n=1 Tax=hydrothermal vent metagenome TaxID=652676 RepID=A0A3B0SC60_9ZZZZ
MLGRSRVFVNIMGSIVAKIGTIMLMWWNYARNTADACGQTAKGLERGGFAGNVISVVAASPQGAGTHSLNRYPSPYGRLCALRRRPPFFRYITKRYVDRLGFSGIGKTGAHGFDRGRGITLNGGITPHNIERATAGCSFLLYFFYRYWRFLPLQPVAKRRWNKSLSVAARVQARRLCRMGMLQRGPLLPIARHIPTAATDATRPIGVFLTKFRPSVAFSYAGPGAMQCAGPCC